MTAFLLFIKHNVPAIWALIDWLNAVLFRILHGGRVKKAAEGCISEFTHERYRIRMLGEDHAEPLAALLAAQSEERVAFFHPHGFDRATILKLCRNPSFLMFGVFAGEEIVGYFFLRCFWNRKSFVGRMITEAHEGKGAGRVMNQILYNTAWRSGFRCMTTISKNNAMVMRAHAGNPTYFVVRELPNDYILVEFDPAKAPMLNKPRAAKG